MLCLYKPTFKEVKTIFDHNLTYSKNRYRILSIIYREKSVTRSQLVKITGLTILTINKIIKTLLNDRLIVETDFKDIRRGRPPVLISINADYAYVIGVDVGAYSVKLGVIKFNGEILESEIFFTPQPLCCPVEILSFSDLEEKINRLIQKYDNKIMGIGMGISGMVNHNSSTIEFCPNIKGYDNISLGSKFNANDFSVAVDTSARCMALAEFFSQPEDETDNLIYVAIGYSIAAGIIIDKKIFRGANGYAGEIGHVKVEYNTDIQCSCGSYGCVENYSTLPMIKDSVISKLSEYNGYSLLNKICEDPNLLTLDDLSRAYQDGDKTTVEAVHEAIDKLGYVLADYVNLVNPSHMILGGGFMDLFPGTLELLKSKIQGNGLTPALKNFTIKKSALGPEGAIYGSALQILCKEFLKE